jgi:hypothetical protein
VKLLCGTFIILCFIQGIPFEPYALNELTTGQPHENGTWTGALGVLQSGHVDIWASYAYVTEQRSSRFIYTTPFILSKYGALMKRQNGMLEISLGDLCARINLSVYASIFAILMVIFTVSLMNERFDVSTRTNSTWHLLTVLFPMNGEMLRYQTGATRKVLMATSGFSILIFSSLYQAKLSEVLMVPELPPLVTLNDIEKLVSSGRAKLMLDDINSPVSNYIKNVSHILSTSNAIYLNVQSTPEYFNVLNNENGILIETESTLLDVINNMDARLCEKYVYVSMDEWTRTYKALILRKDRVDMLESMNVIVAERMPFVDEYIRSFEVNEECRKHIFPVKSSSPTYLSLKLIKISGSLTFLFTFLCLSVVVFAFEIGVNKFYSKDNINKQEDTFRIFEIRHQFIDNTYTSKKREKIFTKYLELLDLIDEQVLY